MIIELADQIVQQRQQHKTSSAFLVAISGIDGSGKSTLAKGLEFELSKRGFNIAHIGIDPWHQLGSIRFSPDNPAEHFYHHAFRWDDLFQQLIVPLKNFRNMYATFELHHIQHDEPYAHTYFFRNIDIILLEGIFLLKKEHQHYYDFSVWIECSFESALEHAIQRNQEGLTKEEIIREYETIYFPAERLHFERDTPSLHANFIMPSGVSMNSN